jgi:hypothetical protein
VIAERAHPAHALTNARQVAREHGFVRPPVIVHTIARQLGFAVKPRDRLGSLRARLGGKVIEVNPTSRRWLSASQWRTSSATTFPGAGNGDGEIAERDVVANDAGDDVDLGTPVRRRVPHARHPLATCSPCERELGCPSASARASRPAPVNEMPDPTGQPSRGRS